MLTIIIRLSWELSLFQRILGMIILISRIWKLHASIRVYVHTCIYSYYIHRLALSCLYGRRNTQLGSYGGINKITNRDAVRVYVCTAV